MLPALLRLGDEAIATTSLGISFRIAVRLVKFTGQEVHAGFCIFPDDGPEFFEFAELGEKAGEFVGVEFLEVLEFDVFAKAAELLGFVEDKTQFGTEVLDELRAEVLPEGGEGGCID